MLPGQLIVVLDFIIVFNDWGHMMIMDDHVFYDLRPWCVEFGN